MILLTNYKYYRAIITNVDDYYVGVVQNTLVHISLCGDNIAEIKETFHEAIDDYIRLKSIDDLPNGMLY